MFSLAFHAAVIGFLGWMAAREGLRGLPLKKVTVNLLREAPPQKPPAAEKPKIEPPKAKAIPVSEPAPAQKQSVAASPVSSSAPTPIPVSILASPPPVDLPPLVFEDKGQAVQTSTDPSDLYRGYVEFSLRSRWNRPDDIDDAQYVAEIEIAVDPSGHVSEPRWKHKTGNARWDASVLDAITQTRKLNRPPPHGFPPRVTLRFDVLQTDERLAQ